MLLGREAPQLLGNCSMVIGYQRKTRSNRKTSCRKQQLLNQPFSYILSPVSRLIPLSLSSQFPFLYQVSVRTNYRLFAFLSTIIYAGHTGEAQAPSDLTFPKSARKKGVRI